MKYLENELLIPFNIKDKYGMWFDKNSYDWGELLKKEKQSLFGQIDATDRFGDVILSEISHQIINIKIKDSGVYGDILILEFGYGLNLKALLHSGIDMVFRNAAAIEYDNDTGYCKIADIWGFSAIVKKDDVYGDIIYRRKKLNKILHEIQKG